LIPLLLLAERELSTLPEAVGQMPFMMAVQVSLDWIQAVVPAEEETVQ
jgi:hypothetical protein